MQQGNGERLVASLENLSPRRLLDVPVDAFLAQLWLFGVAVTLWIVHGLPPLSELRRLR